MGNELVQCHLGHFEGIGGFEKGMETGLEGVRQSLASREGESKGGRLGGGGTGQGCVCVCVRGVCVCVCVCVKTEYFWLDLFFFSLPSPVTLNSDDGFFHFLLIFSMQN